MRKLVESLFFPPFLRRFDEKLLLERPWLWSTRLHKVAWPALILVLLSVGVGMLTPIDRPHATMQFIKMGLFAIVAMQVGLIIYWLHGQDGYNVEREHGTHRDKTGWREFGTSIAAFALISMSAFSFVAAAQQRVQTIPKDRFAYDLLLIETVSDLDNHITFEKDLNRIIDRYVLGNFSGSQDRVNWRSGSYQFIEQYANPDDFVPLHQQVNEGNYQGVMDVVSRYAGYPVELSENENWDSPFWMGKRDAFNNVDGMFKLAFNPTNNLLLTFGAVLGAFIVHLSLLRFVYKHSGRKGLIALPILLVSYQFLSFFAFMSGSLFNRIDWLLLPLLLGAITLFVALFITVHRISSQAQFTWKTAAALYVFPICLIAAPYLIFGVVEIAFDKWFSTHFINPSTSTWSVAPLGKYMLYFAQFAYVPLLGWLKQKHTQLMSLPRN